VLRNITCRFITCRYAFAVPLRRLAELRVTFEADIVSNRDHLAPDVSFYNVSQVYAVNPLLVYHPEGYSNTFHNGYTRALRQRWPAQICTQQCVASRLPQNSVCGDGRLRQLECHVVPSDGACAPRTIDDRCRGTPTRVSDQRRWAAFGARNVPTLALLVIGAIDQFELASKLAYAQRNDVAIVVFLVVHQRAVAVTDTHQRLFSGTFDQLFSAFDSANVTVVGYAYNAVLEEREALIDGLAYTVSAARRRLLTQLDARRRVAVLLKRFETLHNTTFDAALLIGANTLLAGAPRLDALRRHELVVRPPYPLLDALAEHDIVDDVVLLRHSAIMNAIRRRIIEV
jgi:hypothetical protein